MQRELEILSRDELDLLKLMPVWVSMLVAGADSKFDKKELRRAILLARSKKEVEEESLRDFYREIAEQFELNFKGYMALLPNDASARNRILVSRITKLNKILPKLDRQFAAAYYHTLKEFALEVAKAAGGVFGIGAINSEEAQYIDLPMLDDPSSLDNEIK
jgi:hypothetical protein